MKTAIFTSILIFSFFTKNAFAGDVITQFGPPEINGKSYVSAGYRFIPWNSKRWIRIESIIGIKNENIFAKNPILVIDFSPMIYLNPSFLYFRFSNGIAMISRKDLYLNSYYQFVTTAAIGVTQGPVSMGLMWKHYSNGSGSLSNKGWNFRGLEFSYDF